MVHVGCWNWHGANSKAHFWLKKTPHQWTVLRYLETLMKEGSFISRREASNNLISDSGQRRFSVLSLRQRPTLPRRWIAYKPRHPQAVRVHVYLFTRRNGILSASVVQDLSQATPLCRSGRWIQIDSAHCFHWRRQYVDLLMAKDCDNSIPVGRTNALGSSIRIAHQLDGNIHIPSKKGSDIDLLLHIGFAWYSRQSHPRAHRGA